MKEVKHVVKTEQITTKKPQQLDTWWINGAFVAVTHIVGVLALLLYTPTWQSVALAFLSHQISCIGITMGYHRLWSHRAFTASWPLRFVLAVAGTMGFQGSIKWWVLRHRIHHRWTDTDDDPYSAKKGFFFSHMGWIFEKPLYKKMVLIDASDLNADPLVTFQHAYYPFLAVLSGFVAPALIGTLWNDSLGAFLYAGVVARIAVWHCTFFINSFAHWIGEQDFSTKMTARGNLLLALLTVGEGYHNYHHEFPKDYRNGIDMFDWDPTKWAIYLCSMVGLASDLYRTPQAEIEKAKIDVLEKKVMEAKAKCDYGPDPLTLPLYYQKTLNDDSEDSGALSMADLIDANPEKFYIIINDLLLDITNFEMQHPGGSKILRGYRNKDASKAFDGGMNDHTDSARRWLKMLVVGRVIKQKEE